MTNFRDTPSPENPACTRCGHPYLRHVFGNAWCTVRLSVPIGRHGSHPACDCAAYQGPQPGPPPVDTAIVASDGLAALAYVKRPA